MSPPDTSTMSAVAQGFEDDLSSIAPGLALVDEIPDEDPAADEAEFSRAEDGVGAAGTRNDFHDTPTGLDFMAEPAPPEPVEDAEASADQAPITPAPAERRAGALSFMSDLDLQLQSRQSRPSSRDAGAGNGRLAAIDSTHLAFAEIPEPQETEEPDAAAEPAEMPEPVENAVTLPDVQSGLTLESDADQVFVAGAGVAENGKAVLDQDIDENDPATADPAADLYQARVDSTFGGATLRPGLDGRIEIVGRTDNKNSEWNLNSGPVTRLNGIEYDANGKPVDQGENSENGGEIAEAIDRSNKEMEERSKAWLESEHTFAGQTWTGEEWKAFGEWFNDPDNEAAWEDAMMAETGQSRDEVRKTGKKIRRLNELNTIEIEGKKLTPDQEKERKTISDDPKVKKGLSVAEALMLRDRVKDNTATPEQRDRLREIERANPQAFLSKQEMSVKDAAKVMLEIDNGTASSIDRARLSEVSGETLLDEARTISDGYRQIKGGDIISNVGPITEIYNAQATNIKNQSNDLVASIKNPEAGLQNSTAQVKVTQAAILPMLSAQI